MTKDELWKKSNDAFGGFVPGIHSGMVYRKHTDHTNYRSHILHHVARYAAIALLGAAIGLAAAYWPNWRSHSEATDFPIMAPGGGANIPNGYVIRIPVNQMLVMPTGI